MVDSTKNHPDLGTNCHGEGFAKSEFEGIMAIRFIGEHNWLTENAYC